MPLRGLIKSTGGPHSESTSIEISEVSAIVVFMIFGPQPRRTFGGAATRNCDTVSLFDDCSVFSEKGDHLTVTTLVRQFVVGCAD